MIHDNRNFLCLARRELSREQGNFYCVLSVYYKLKELSRGRVAGPTTTIQIAVARVRVGGGN